MLDNLRINRVEENIPPFESSMCLIYVLKNSKVKTPC